MPLSFFTATTVEEILSDMTQRHPSSPLSLISVSGSSTLACVLAKSLEVQGRIITDVSFLDHFPALFCHYAHGLHPFMASEEQSPEILKAMDDVAEKGVEIMLRMQEVDQTTSKQSPTTTRIQGLKHLETARLINVLTVKTVKDVYYRELHHPSEAYDATLVRCLASIKAPILLVLADQ